METTEQIKTELKTTYLKNYAPPAYLIDWIKLDIDLQDQVTTVRSELLVKKNLNNPDSLPNLVLNGEELVLKSVVLNNKPLATTDYSIDSQTLTINNVPNEFKLEIVTEIKPQNNTQLSGLYKSERMYCTQCEAQGFRRITYYLDRPDVLAKYTVTIHADKHRYPVLLANGNLIAQGSDNETRHYATWEDPFYKPCYLFAMVAGDLVAAEDRFLTKSGRLVTLKVYVDRENLSQTPHALAALRKAMAWDEEAYGREYDLDIYMIVAANDFNMGAMENKGLNIFNAQYVLVSPETATDYNYHGVDLVIGHEYFHNWSGNRVTCRDWFQLSLKEGFTVFREQQFTQHITKSPVARINQVESLITRQFAEDSGPLAHPVQPSSYVEINNFYTMTVYEKGAEVIRMLLTILGPQKFRQGTDLYFSRYDGQAATIEDFVAVMQEVSGLDLKQFQLWYHQAGTPEISVAESYDPQTQRYTLKLAQYIPATPQQEAKQPMHIPIAVGLIDANGAEILESTKVLSLVNAEQEFVFENIAHQPHLSILRDFSAPVRIKREVSDEELAFIMVNDNDNYTRWFAGQQLFMHAIDKLIQAKQQNQEMKLPEIIADSFNSLLFDEDVNLELKAELLSLPATQLIIDNMRPADPDLIYAAKKFMATELAKQYSEPLFALYDKFNINQQYRYIPEQVAQRTMKHTVLGYLMTSKSSKAIKIAFDQYHNSNNMTDTMGALGALASVDCNERIETLLDFYNRWSSNPLVVNKWLNIQATADLDQTLQNVHSLMKHAAFDIKNPNKVYALVGGFCIGNPVKFHVASGDGYRFLADVVLQLNSLNPQVAARMLTPLAQWRQFTSNRQKMMCDELQRISRQSNLSDDVLEIVTKSLV